LNWIICKGAIPIPGVKTPAQVAENAGALGWRLETGEVAALDRVSLEVS
jgi:pyridoxine 4-dehydrogenase